MSRSAPVNSRETEHLRVLIANERSDRLALVAPIVATLGHEVIARETDVEHVGAVTASERPDVALVGLGHSAQHALEMIEKIVGQAACPVIALIHGRDPVLRRGGVEARGLRLHRRVRRGGLAELDRHRAAPIRRISRPRRRVRSPRGDRTRQGHPDGTACGRRGERLRDAARPRPQGEPQAHRRCHRCGHRPRTAAEAIETHRSAVSHLEVGGQGARGTRPADAVRGRVERRPAADGRRRSSTPGGGSAISACTDSPASGAKAAM